MDLGLKGKVAVVMASSQGLGFGAALSLSRESMNVAMTARREPELKAAAKRIQAETGGEVFAITGDVSKPSDPARIIDAAVKHFGTRGLDALVNNSGGPKPGPAVSFTDDDWRAAFDLLVLSNVRACRAAFPHMKDRGGSIMNIVSTSVKQPIDHLGLSNSLRAAVIGLAKTLSLEWAPHKIRVNSVLPGSMETPRIMEIVEDQARRESRAVADVRAQREKGIPLGRFGLPEELGQVIAFLASPRSAYVTGQSWSVDGGATRWVHG